MTDKGREDATGAPDLALERRAGLPEALRVLLDAYPREAWQADPGFSGLIRFWLERHLMFRRLSERLETDTQALLDGRLDPARHAAVVGRFGSMFVGELHAHHNIKDMHYFPRLRAFEPRISAGFDLLDADHHAIDSHLAGYVEAANAVLRAPEASRRDPAGAFLARARSFAALLDRHLTDEEDLVVPVLLRHGDAAMH